MASRHDSCVFMMYMIPILMLPAVMRWRSLVRDRKAGRVESLGLDYSEPEIWHGLLQVRK